MHTREGSSFPLLCARPARACRAVLSADTETDGALWAIITYLIGRSAQHAAGGRLQNASV